MNFKEYLLVSLAEECAEVAQRATKALRFGLDEVQPGQERTNAVRLVDELDDLAVLVDLCRVNRLIPVPPDTIHLIASPSEKRAKVFKYMDLAERQGTLVQEFTRAAGNVTCQHCLKVYSKHPLGGPFNDTMLAEPFQFLHRLCDGRLVKL